MTYPESPDAPDQPDAPWVPPWIERVGMPVWMCDPAGLVTYVNERAAEMLGLRAGSCVGSPCHDVFQGTDSDGRRFCAPRCKLYRSAARGDELEPFELCFKCGTRDEVRVQVVAITETDPAGGGPYLVHCVIEKPSRERAIDFLRRVATRSVPAQKAPPSPSVLTPREQEILHRLAEDESLFEVAAALGVSHATVRNHVQHILAKLEVHSIIEAVARYLLKDETN